MREKVRKLVDNLSWGTIHINGELVYEGPTPLLRWLWNISPWYGKAYLVVVEVPVAIVLSSVHELRRRLL